MREEIRTDTCWVRIDGERLDADSAYAFVVSDRAGAVDLFIGTTRRWTGDHETTGLSYEAYVEMAIDEMMRLCTETLTRWPIVRACIHHRIGEVAPSQASVVVAVSSPHRADAFEACRFLIDRLKEDVPIWKRERFADGTEDWVRPMG